MTYRLTRSDVVIRLADDAFIPADPRNRDREEYAAWLAAGNTPLPVDPPTPEQLQAALEAAVQSHLDSRAAERGYSGILSATSYATSNHPRFGAEGRAYAAWRDAVWDYCYQELAAVQQGLRAIPTVEALIAELPALVLP